MQEQENATTLRRLLMALLDRRPEAAAGLLTPDVKYQIAGRSAIAGKYRGKEEALAAIARMVEMTAHTLRPQVHDILANDQHGIIINRVRAERGGSRLDYEVIHLCHFRSGLVSEVMTVPVDQSAFDQFYS